MPISGPKARHVIARPEGPGNRFQIMPQGLKGRHKIRTTPVPPLQGGEVCSWTCSRAYSPGCHIAGFQPSAQRQIVVERDALQAEVDALKRLQAETAADPPSSNFGATWLAALLPAILDRGFKGEL